MGASIDTGFFPIMAWGSTPGDISVLNGMAECGLNVAGFVTPGDLDLVAQAGLRAFVMDPKASEYNFRKIDLDKVDANVTNLVKEVGDNPALMGYLLKDEPHINEFSGLAVLTEAFQEASPNKIPYINLYPNYANQNQLGTENYWEYVETYVNTVNPPIISYDHYALMENEPLRDGYYTNLEAMRWASIKYRRPFWNVVLSTAHFNYRELSSADIRFQVFTTLAYGGKGISYFTYFSPRFGNCRMAPIDQFGNRTPTWSYLQNVNMMVQMLAPTLMELTSTGVYHIGDVPKGCLALPGNTLTRALYGNGNFIVGEFVHSDGSNYIMVVNKDFKNSANFRLELNDPNSHVYRVSSYTGRLEELVDEGDWLAPGQGVLLQVTPKGI
jgi:hypothetical protein